MKDKAIKTEINKLGVGDFFTYNNQHNVFFKVTRIDGDTIFFIRNGKEYNSLYDNSPIRKILN